MLKEGAGLLLSVCVCVCVTHAVNAAGQHKGTQIKRAFTLTSEQSNTAAQPKMFLFHLYSKNVNVKVNDNMKTDWNSVKNPNR